MAKDTYIFFGQAARAKFTTDDSGNMHISAVELSTELAAIVGPLLGFNAVPQVADIGGNEIKVTTEDLRSLPPSPQGGPDLGAVNHLGQSLPAESSPLPSPALPPPAMLQGEQPPSPLPPLPGMASPLPSPQSIAPVEKTTEPPVVVAPPAPLQPPVQPATTPSIQEEQYELPFDIGLPPAGSQTASPDMVNPVQIPGTEEEYEGNMPPAAAAALRAAAMQPAIPVPLGQVPTHQPEAGAGGRPELELGQKLESQLSQFDSQTVATDTPPSLQQMPSESPPAVELPPPPPPLAPATEPQPTVSAVQPQESQPPAQQATRQNKVEAYYQALPKEKQVRCDTRLGELMAGPRETRLMLLSQANPAVDPASFAALSDEMVQHQIRELLVIMLWQQHQQQK